MGKWRVAHRPVLQRRSNDPVQVSRAMQGGDSHHASAIGHSPYQVAHARARAAVAVHANGRRFGAEQPFGRLAQGRAREGRVERLQGAQFQQRGRAQAASRPLPQAGLRLPSPAYSTRP